MDGLRDNQTETKGEREKGVGGRDAPDSRRLGSLETPAGGVRPTLSDPRVL